MVDPVENTKAMIPVPLPNEADQGEIASHVAAKPG